MTAMRLDHVVYACGPEGFAGTVEDLGWKLGTPITAGGVHPRFGTRNAILPLAGGVYLEIVGVLDHPSADSAPFGQAVKRKIEAGGGWMGWVVSVEDIRPVERRLGRESVQGSRRRPDGYELRWKQLGVKGLLNDPLLPFFIEWQVPESERPTAQAFGEHSLDRLKLAGDPAALAEWLGKPADHPLDSHQVDWVEGERGIVSVEFSTPSGLIRI
jgi:hypothetical protein